MSLLPSRLLLLALAILAPLVLVACDDEDPETSEVVSSIPWTVPEVAQYELAESDRVVGLGTFRIEQDGENLALIQDFQGDNGSSDVRAVIVRPSDIQPVSMERVVKREDGSTLTTIRAGYGPDAVSFENTTDDRTVTQTRDRLPNTYDTEQHLFLGRTVPLAEDFSIHYRAMDSATTQSRIVEMRVDEQEEVTVPAGAFMTWKVEFRHASAKTTAWYTVEAPHYLVKAEVDDFEYRLLALPEGAAGSAN